MGMTLFDVEPILTPRERFEEFHRENPHVYERLRYMSLELVANGHSRIGMGMLFEVLRWSAMTTRDGDFKLNNNYRAFYSRMLMENEPELRDVFELREQHL